jgi:hypothetical protein
MKNTIYFAKIKIGYKICIIDKDGAVMGNAEIPLYSIGLTIDTFIEHINDDETEVKEVSEVNYDKLLNKGIEVAKSKKYIRVTDGNDPSNPVSN